MENCIRINLIKSIEVPKTIRPCNLARKACIPGLIRKISPVKEVKAGCNLSSITDSSSPNKYNRRQTFLSLIEEDCERDEKSNHGSESSSCDSVSPNSNSKSEIELLKKSNVQLLAPNKSCTQADLSGSQNSPIQASPNIILNQRYNPCPKKSLREEYNYPNFDAYFSSTFKLNENYTGKNLQEKKYVKKFDLMMVAEEYLINLGDNLFLLRNHQNELRTAEYKDLDQIILRKGISLKTKKRSFIKNIKKRKIKNKEPKYIRELSSKLFEIENSLDIKANEASRKLTQDVTCSVNEDFKKRGRFWTCSTSYEFQATLTDNPSDKELSIKLENEKVGYAKSFKNYALKRYDDFDEEERKGQEETYLNLNLNPCLPVESYFRKKSSNSQNLHQNNPLQSIEDLDESEIFLKNLEFKKKCHSNSVIPDSNHDTTSCSGIKSKEQKNQASSAISENTRVKSPKKKRKKDRKLSISNTEFNAFYSAFEKHSKTKMNKSFLTPSIPSTVNSGQMSYPQSPISLDKTRKPIKGLKKLRKKKIYSPQKVLKNLESCHKKPKGGNKPCNFSWKMNEIIVSLDEIEKRFD
ncbi:unnamed protein product [Moneuplotes crassus]|uniref:Uncharacterized protein n=1 Tax=Euplotes crassus TaxID=5936 RepID=A0AAD1X5L7_EUPCR|nr:unnamed protein product [Moneuplotes crassus]